MAYLSGRVARFQFLLCFPLLYPSAMAINLPLDQLGPNLADGLYCFSGTNTITGVAPGSRMCTDDCASAPLYVPCFIVFNLVWVQPEANLLGRREQRESAQSRPAGQAAYSGFPRGKGADLRHPRISSFASPHRPKASASALEPRRREYL